MKDEGIQPDVIAYNAVLDACGKKGSRDELLKYLKEMDNKGFEPDLVTYTILISAFGKLVLIFFYF